MLQPERVLELEQDDVAAEGVPNGPSRSTAERPSAEVSSPSEGDSHRSSELYAFAATRSQNRVKSSGLMNGFGRAGRASRHRWPQVMGSPLGWLPCSPRWADPLGPPLKEWQVRSAGDDPGLRKRGHGPACHPTIPPVPLPK